MSQSYHRLRRSIRFNELIASDHGKRINWESRRRQLLQHLVVISVMYRRKFGRICKFTSADISEGMIAPVPPCCSLSSKAVASDLRALGDDVKILKVVDHRTRSRGTPFNVYVVRGDVIDAALAQLLEEEEEEDFTGTSSEEEEEEEIEEEQEESEREEETSPVSLCDKLLRLVRFESLLPKNKEPSFNWNTTYGTVMKYCLSVLAIQWFRLQSSPQQLMFRSGDIQEVIRGRFSKRQVQSSIGKLVRRHKVLEVKPKTTWYVAQRNIMKRLIRQLRSLDSREKASILELIRTGDRMEKRGVEGLEQELPEEVLGDQSSSVIDFPATDGRHPHQHDFVKAMLLTEQARMIVRFQGPSFGTRDVQTFHAPFSAISFLDITPETVGLLVRLPRATRDLVRRFTPEVLLSILYDASNEPFGANLYCLFHLFKSMELFREAYLVCKKVLEVDSLSVLLTLAHCCAVENAGGGGGVANTDVCTLLDGKRSCYPTLEDTAFAKAVLARLKQLAIKVADPRCAGSVPLWVVNHLKTASSSPSGDEFLRNCCAEFASLADPLPTSFARLVSKQYKRMFLKPGRPFSNVELHTCDGGVEKAHIEFLAYRSAFFCDMMLAKLTEFETLKLEGMIKLENMNHRTLVSLLGWIYGIEDWSRSLSAGELLELVDFGSVFEEVKFLEEARMKLFQKLRLLGGLSPRLCLAMEKRELLAQIHRGDEELYRSLEEHFVLGRKGDVLQTLILMPELTVAIKKKSDCESKQ